MQVLLILGGLALLVLGARWLVEAAILFALSVEESETGRPHDLAWDRLRKAALRHQEGPRKNGRPKK